MTRAVVLLLACVCIIVPVDFVVVTPRLKFAADLSVVAGAVLGSLLVFRSRRRYAITLSFGVLFLLTQSMVVGGGVSAFATIWGPVALGIAVALSSREPIKIMLLSGVVVSLSLLADWLFGAHVISGIFGRPYQEGFLGGDFRARGIVGQPVPGAFFLVVTAAAIGASGVRLKSKQFAFALAAMGFLALVVTGTRSALVVAAALGLGVFAKTISIAVLNRRLASRSLLAFVGGSFVVGFSVLFSLFFLDAGGLRIADFSSLQSSASLLNRIYALEILQRWVSTCDFSCKLFGSGARSLQVTLGGDVGGYGFSTVDNLFMSVLWDFGLIGLFLILGLFFWEILYVVRRSRDRGVRRAGSVGIVLLIASGLFFDSLYLRALLVLFGLCVGLRALPMVDYRLNKRMPV